MMRPCSGGEEPQVSVYIAYNLGGGIGHIINQARRIVEAMCGKEEA